MPRYFKYVLCSVIAFAGLVGLMVAALVTTSGQRLILAVASKAVTSNDFRLTIGRLNGSLLSRGRIKRLAISDRHGAWLLVEDVRLTWSALSLLRSEIDIEELAIGKVLLTRLPEQTEGTRSRSGNYQLPVVPLQLQRLHIDQLRLGKEVIGAAARFRIEASANFVDHRNGHAAQFSVRRLDRPGAQIEGRFGYDNQSKRLAVQLLAAEPANGLIATLLQRPQRPALQLEFAGGGPLDAWRSNWSLSASGQPFVAGRAHLDKDGERYRLATDFSGYVQQIVPRSVANLAKGKTVGSLIGFFNGANRLEVSDMRLRNDAITLRGRGGFVPASSYAFGSISLDMARADGKPIEFMLTGNDRLALRKLRLKLDLPDKRAARDLSLDVTLEDLVHPLAAVSKVQLVSRGRQENPRGKNARSVERLKLELTTDGFSSPLRGIAEAIGARPKLRMVGSMKSGVLAVDHFRLGDETAHLVGRARLSDNQQTASARLTVTDLRRVATLLGHPLAGRLHLNATTSASINDGGFDISLKGAADKVALGHGALTDLIGEKVAFSGDVTRSAAGDIRLNKLLAKSTNLKVAAEGVYGPRKINLVHRIRVGNLSAIDARLSGAGEIELSLRGTPSDLTSKIRGSTPDLTWRGNAVQRMALQFDGNGPLAAHRGRLIVDGRLGQTDFSTSARLSFAENGFAGAQDIAVKMGLNALSGNVRLVAAKRPSGKFFLNAPRLADLDAIVGQKIAGALTGTIELFEENQQPSIRLNVDAPSLTFAGSTLKTLKAKAALRDVARNIAGEASLTVAKLSSDDMTVRNVSVDLRDRNGRMAFASSARVNGASIKVDGSFTQRDKAVDVILERADLKHGALKVKLVDRAQLAFADGDVRIQRLKLTTGRGHLALDGRATADELDVNAKLSRIPAAVANAFVSDVGLGGTISGRARIKGTPQRPDASVAATWRRAMAKAMRENAIPPVDIKLNGTVSGGIAKARIGISGPGALVANIDGDVTLDEGNRMRLRIAGNVPLSLANATFAARAAQVSGRAKIKGTIRGTVQAPQLDAEVSIPNASMHDPTSGIELRRVVGLLKLTETGLEIRQLKGESALGGTLSITGAVARARQQRPHVRVNARLAQFKLNDRHLLAGNVDSNITVAGPLDALAASGTVFVRRLDVTVPAAMPRTITALNVKHVNAPRRVKQSVIADHQPTGNAAPMNIALDLRLDAANRIFVKGRGLDAQLGGRLNVTGTSTAPATDGAFIMQRGRLDILGRRLDFQRGRVVFDGALEPVLDMEAVTVADDVTIAVTISGMASRPVFTFSSRPELPEDEVIARLLFNKGLVGLSPLQLAQLASEIDKIGGMSSGPGILDQLKRSIGVDVLDVATDKKGAATVSAGRYLTDKTFVGVKQGVRAGSSRVIIDHDFTKNLKARGEVGADGNSKLGIGLEWNY